MSALLDDGHQFFLEAHLQQSVCFVKNQQFDILKSESFSVVDMIYKSSCRRYHDIRTFRINKPLLVLKA